MWGWDKSPGQVGVPGLVNKANCSREEAGFVARGFGPDGPHPPAGGKNLKEFYCLLFIKDPH